MSKGRAVSLVGIDLVGAGGEPSAPVPHAMHSSASLLPKIARSGARILFSPVLYFSAYFFCAVAVCVSLASLWLRFFGGKENRAFCDAEGAWMCYGLYLSSIWLDVWLVIWYMAARSRGKHLAGSYSQVPARELDGATDDEEETGGGFQHDSGSPRSSTWRCRLHKTGKHDVFLSYRVQPDQPFVEKLWAHLAGINITAFLDRKCLNDGENWRDGFLNGLRGSRVVVLALSRAGLLRARSAHEVTDNVLLEFDTALDLHDRGEIDILPVLLPDASGEDGGPFGSQRSDWDVSVYPDSPPLRDDSLDLHGQQRTVREIIARVFEIQGIGAGEGEIGISTVSSAIEKKLNESAIVDSGNQSLGASQRIETIFQVISSDAVKDTTTRGGIADVRQRLRNFWNACLGGSIIFLTMCIAFLGVTITDSSSLTEVPIALRDSGTIYSCVNVIFWGVYGWVLLCFSMMLFRMESQLAGLLARRFTDMLRNPRVYCPNEDVLHEQYMLVLSAYNTMSLDWSVTLFALTCCVNLAGPATMHTILLGHPPLVTTIAVCLTGISAFIISNFVFIWGGAASGHESMRRIILGSTPRQFRFVTGGRLGLLNFIDGNPCHWTLSLFGWSVVLTQARTRFLAVLLAAIWIASATTALSSPKSHTSW